MNPKDRRVIRTKRLLYDALFSLVAENGYDALTVNQIADRADVGRATFYMHYGDKDELLREALTAEFEALAAFLESKRSPERMRLRDLFGYIAQQPAHFRVLLTGIGKPNVYLFTRDFMARRLLARLREVDPAQPALPPEVIALHMAGSILNLLIWWLDNQLPNSPEALEGMCQQLIGHGVWRTLGIEPPDDMLV
jgi:AcrR family transcriptional regulator